MGKRCHEVNLIRTAVSAYINRREMHSARSERQIGVEPSQTPIVALLARTLHRDLKAACNASVGVGEEPEMKAIRFDGFGSADVMHLAKAATPKVRPGDLLVRVGAAGVNRADLLQRAGFYGRENLGDSE